MFKTITTVVATLAVSGIACAQWEKDIQWPTGSGGNNHWYRLATQDNGISWQSAKQAAEAQGGHLVTCTSADEDDFVRDNLVECTNDGVPNKPAWMGGRKVNGDWTWITGEEWSFTNWAANDPNDSDPDAVLNFHPSESDGCGWADVGPGATMDYYVIEFSADCNDDGIVDHGQILDGSLSDENGNGVPDCCDDNSCIPAVQWKIEDGGNGHWYQGIVHDEISYQEAQDQAVALGGQLTSLTSQEESDYVTNFIADKPDFWVYDVNGCFCGGPWIGGYREAYGDWFWLDGESWSYTNWNGGNPDGNVESAQALRLWDYCCKRWVDHSMDGETGSVVISSIIEWSADCNGDGIVDYGQILDGSLADDDGNGIPDSCELGDFGACCLAGTCVITTADYCFAANGSFAGIGINCDDANCPTSCPGDIDGDGQVGIVDILVVIDRWGLCP
ncbi:MAG: hypothetical protein MK116_10145 [Phycisphaerales bacterium]|nr:hypothetical protein [Phycisphaerales bacterium]